MPRPTPSPAKPATGIKQTVQARHGVATYVPQGYTIKIINTYGKQVVDTWAFALHAPPEDSEIQKDGEREGSEQDEAGVEGKVRDAVESGSKAARGDGKDSEIPREEEMSGEAAGGANGPDTEGGEDQEDTGLTDNVKQTTEKAEDKAGEVEEKATNTAETSAEVAKETTAEGVDKAQSTAEQAKEKVGESTKQVQGKAEDTAEEVEEKASESTPKKSRWSAYIPSLQRNKTPARPKDQTETEAAVDEKMSKSWSSYLGVGGGGGGGQKDGSSSNTNSQKKGWSAYIPSGQGFSSYIPSKDGLSIAAFTGERDATKSYAEQLLDFSKTPVGAAGLSGEFSACNV